MMTIKKIIGWGNLFLFDKIARWMRPILLNKIERQKLHNQDFTILSQNCIGSIMYHDLGQKFMSPTINMKFDANDWIKFLKGVNKYLNSSITFIDNPKVTYPTGYIGDCFVEFVHYHDKEEVIRKWEQRKERINWNNLFVLACDRGMTVDNIKSFAWLDVHKDARYLMFVCEETYCQLSQKELATGRYLLQNYFKDGSDARLLNFSSVLGHRYYNFVFDYVKFLNNYR